MQRLIVLYCKAISDRRMAGALWLDITEMGKEDVEERLGHTYSMNTIQTFRNATCVDMTNHQRLAVNYRGVVFGGSYLTKGPSCTRCVSNFYKPKTLCTPILLASSLIRI
jgi:hypothetical protein